MTVLIQAGRSAVRCARLIVRRQLHLRHDQVGKEISLPDGRTYVVFRESTRDDPIVSDAGDVGGLVPPAHDPAGRSNASMALRAPLPPEHIVVRRVRRVSGEALDGEPDDIRLRGPVFMAIRRRSRGVPANTSPPSCGHSRPSDRSGTRLFANRRSTATSAMYDERERVRQDSSASDQGRNHARQSRRRATRKYRRPMLPAMGRSAEPGSLPLLPRHPTHPSLRLLATRPERP